MYKGHFTTVPLQTVCVGFKPQILQLTFISQDILLVDSFTFPLSFMLLWMRILNHYKSV